MSKIQYNNVSDYKTLNSKAKKSAIYVILLM